MYFEQLFLHVLLHHDRDLSAVMKQTVNFYDFLELPLLRMPVFWFRETQGIAQQNLIINDNSGR